MPYWGSLTLNGEPVYAGQFVSVSDIDAYGLIYTPPADTTLVTAFTFQVQNDGGPANGGIDTDPIARIMTILVS